MKALKEDERGLVKIPLPEESMKIVELRKVRVTFSLLFPSRV